MKEEFGPFLMQEALDFIQEKTDSSVAWYGACFASAPADSKYKVTVTTPVDRQPRYHIGPY